MLLTKVNKKWAGFVPAHFSLSKNPDFGEEIGVEVLIKDENRQKILKTAEKWGERGDIRPHSFFILYREVIVDNHNRFQVWRHTIRYCYLWG